MLTEELLNINKVVETHSQAEANEFLQNGWKLLNIYTMSFSIEYMDQANIYVLGKSEELSNI
jgi:hypothetical protein